MTQYISVLRLSVCAWLSSPCLPGERCRCFLGVAPTEAQGKHCAFSQGPSTLFSWIWGKDEMVGYGFPHEVNPGSICVPYNPAMCCKMVVSFLGGQETGGVCSFLNHKYSHDGQSQALLVNKGRVKKIGALEYLALCVLSSLHLLLSSCLLSGYLLSQREHSLYEAAERIMLVLGVPLFHHRAGLVHSRTFTNFHFPSVTSCPFSTPHLQNTAPAAIPARVHTQRGYTHSLDGNKRCWQNWNLPKALKYSEPSALIFKFGYLL